MFFSFSNLILAVWNTTLAVIPFLISCYLLNNYQKNYKNFTINETSIFLIAFIVWFFFFPNIPYLFLDFRHINGVCEPDYLNRCNNHPGILLLLFTFVIIGIPLFIISLEQMRLVFMKIFNQTISYIFVMLMIPMTAFGLHFGLLERFNSWDIVLHPFEILKIANGILMTPEKLITVLEFSFSLYAIFFFLRYFFKNFELFFKNTK